MRSALVVAALALAGPVQAGPGVPARVGQCSATRVKAVETRLVDGSTNRPVAGSGSAVTFRNGLYQVSYDQVPAVDRSRPGDPIRLCLVSLPRHCPPGDDRGKVYKATNLRTHASWALPDAEHMCGGA